jgi:hypothetical protein
MKKANRFFSLGILVFILASGLVLAGCGDNSGGGGGGKGTLVVQNVSTYADEIITEVRTTNYDTGISKRESVGTGISVRAERSFVLDEGQYNILIQTNYDDEDEIEFYLRSGSTVTIKWNGERLSR